jgi:hypothetical protein
MTKADRIDVARQAIDNLTEGDGERDRLLAALTAIVEAIEADPDTVPRQVPDIAMKLPNEREYTADGLRLPLLRVR